MLKSILELIIKVPQLIIDAASNVMMSLVTRSIVKNVPIFGGQHWYIPGVKVVFIEDVVGDLVNYRLINDCGHLSDISFGCTRYELVRFCVLIDDDVDTDDPTDQQEPTQMIDNTQAKEDGSIIHVDFNKKRDPFPPAV